MPRREGQLKCLASVGPATLRDLQLLGIHSVPQVARKDPKKLFGDLCRVTGQPQDNCCFDTFTAAAAQARNPRLPAEQRNWWFWSRRRKALESRRGRGRA